MNLDSTKSPLADIAGVAYGLMPRCDWSVANAQLYLLLDIPLDERDGSPVDVAADIIYSLFTPSPF